MKKVVDIIIKTIIPLIVIVGLETLVGIPDYFNIIIYSILFLIINTYIDKSDKTSIKKSFRKERLIKATIIGIFTLILLMFLKEDSLNGFMYKVLVQIVISLVFSICMVIICSETYVLLWNKKTN